MIDKHAIQTDAEFANSLYRAIWWTQNEIDKRKRNIPGHGDPRTLDYFLEVLLKTRDEFSNAAVPPREERVWGPGRVIVDMWDWDDPYGDLVCRIGQYYKKKL
jgi:hypothetical protein